MVDSDAGAGGEAAAPTFGAPPPHDGDDRAGAHGAPVEWRIERDVLRRTTVARTQYGGPTMIRDGGRASEHYAGEVGVSTVDPAASWATATTRYELSWPEATCLVEARLRVRSDRDAFDVDIELDAALDGQEFARRRWQRRMPRRLL